MLQKKIKSSKFEILKLRLALGKIFGLQKFLEFKSAFLKLIINWLKFGLSEKHTKFEKNLPHDFDKSAELLSKRQNHEEDFFKLCVLLKKSEL